MSKEQVEEILAKESPAKDGNEFSRCLSILAACMTFLEITYRTQYEKKTYWKRFASARRM